MYLVAAKAVLSPRASDAKLACTTARIYAEITVYDVRFFCVSKVHHALSIASWN